MAAENSATAPLLRRLNSTTVLETLRAASAPLTATQLMTATGLSRPTVHGVCEDLIDAGWVREVDSVRPERTSRPGRNARRYAFHAGAAHVLGVDMGAHTLTTVLADLAGATIAEATEPFPDPHVPGRERMATVGRAVRALLTSAEVAESSVIAVGLGVPAPVDVARGTLAAPEEYLPDLGDTDLRAAVAKGTSWEVLVENDANLAVLAERWLGVAVGEADVVVLLAGERLGAGICLDARLVRGGYGRAGEMAFLGMVQGVGNADGIARVTRQLARRMAATPPADAGREAEDVIASARDGDNVASKILETVADRFARPVAALAVLLDPTLIVIGGAVAASGDVLVGAIERRLPSLLRDLRGYDGPIPRVEPSSLGDHAVVLGGVRLALAQAEKTLFSSPINTPAPRRDA